uniref:RNA-binding protein 28-like n=1 Tax=Polistes dominula TaxID=743375 RepID=A0ABM1J0J7_POLDO
MERKNIHSLKNKQIYKENVRKKRARIIIRNLPFQLTEDNLKEYFNEYGKLEEVKILEKNGKSVGCGFVQFDHVQSAAKAIHHANMKILQGRSIVVDWAIPKSKYKKDKNNPGNIKEDNIDAEIKMECEENQNDDSKNDYISLSTEKNQEDIQDLSKEEDIKDEKVTEEMSEEEEEEEADDKELIRRQNFKRESNDVEDGKTIFLKNVPFSTTNNELKKFMEERFGPVYYALICIDRMTEHSRGTAFVKFKNIEDTEKCLSAGTELRLQDEILEPYKALSKKCIMDKNNLKNKKERDTRNLYLVKEGVITAGSPAAVGVSATDMAKRLQLERWKSQILRNLNMFVSRIRLVVQNLPASLDDAKLRLIFKKYGGPTAIIREAKVMRDLKNIDANGVGKSKEFGFVTFTKHEDALRALRAINNNPKIFTPYKRPIVAFSIENRIMVNTKQRRTEKNLARSPLYSGNKKIIPKESVEQKIVQAKSERKVEKEEKTFTGNQSKPGQTKIRSRFNLKNQAILHKKVTKKEKKAVKHDQQSRKMKIEKVKKDVKFKKSAKKRDAENANFNKLVHSYKNKLLAIGPTNPSKWYETSST